MNKRHITVTVVRNPAATVEKPNRIIRIGGAAHVETRANAWRVGDSLTDLEVDALALEYPHLVVVLKNGL